MTVINPLRELLAIKDDVKEIREELSPNSGSSLKDIVISTNKNVQTILARNRTISQFDSRPCFETDDRGLYTWVNRSFLRLVGLTMSELMDHGWKNVLSRDDASRVIYDWNLAIAEKREFQATYTIVDGDGESHKVSCHAIPMVDNSNNLLGYIGFLVKTEIDVAERVLPIQL